MKRVSCITSMIVMILFAATAPAMAADVTAGLDVNTAYVWRGATFNDGLVAQPSIDIAKGAFGFNVWGNFDIDDYDGGVDADNFSEIDLTASYGLTVGNVDVGVGLIEYLFPAGDPGTREIYLSLGMPIAGGLSAGVDVYYDVDEFHGYYISVGLGYAMDLSDKLSLEAGASLGYVSEEYSADDEAGMNDYLLSVSLGYAVSDALSVGASINYVGQPDDDVLPETPDGSYDTQVYGGVSVSYAF